MGVLVFIDVFEGKVTKSSLEAASYAGKIGADYGLEVNAVTYGNADASTLQNLGTFGVKTVHVVSAQQSVQPEVLANLVKGAQEATGASIVVFSQDYTGFERAR